MTPEQMALLKQRIDEMEKKQEEFEAVPRHVVLLFPVVSEESQTTLIH